MFLLFYPLMSVLSPLLGIGALISCKTRLYQAQADFNAVSLFANTVVGLVLTICTSAKDTFTISMGIILIFVKIAIAQLLPIIISYFNNPKYDKNTQFLAQFYNHEDSSRASTPIIKRRPLGSNTSESFIYDSEATKPAKAAKKKAPATGHHRATGIFGRESGAKDASSRRRNSSSDASKDFQLDSQADS